MSLMLLLYTEPLIPAKKTTGLGLRKVVGLIIGGGAVVDVDDVVGEVKDETKVFQTDSLL